MTLEQIWKRLGNQTIHINRTTNAVAIIDGEKYPIEKIEYKSGKPVGFKVTFWHKPNDYPIEGRDIIICTLNGEEIDHHYYNGHCYYYYCKCEDGTCCGSPTQFDFVKWRYKE